MNSDVFDRIVDARLKDCRETLTKKSGEYSRRGDRLSNFRKAGLMDNETPERALWGMYKKHLVSLSDFIADLENNLCMPWPVWQEKIRDTINYAILLEALILERMGMAEDPAEDPAAKYKPIKEYWKKRIRGEEEEPVE